MFNSTWVNMYNNDNMDDSLKEMFKKDSVSNIEEKYEKALVLVKESSGLIEFTGATDSYWKDLETSDTKVMILSIPQGTFIRNANNLKRELSAEDVNGNFLILDGLAYKSNNDYESIVYMKV